MMKYGSEGRGKEFLLRLILGAARGQTPEDFAEQELAIMEAHPPSDGDTPTGRARRRKRQTFGAGRWGFHRMAGWQPKLL